MPLIPETRCFRVKRVLWRIAGAHIGQNVRICSSVRIYGAGELYIGDNTWIGHQAIIATSSRIEIGANTDIAPRVYIGTGTHTIDPSANRIAATDISENVKIGDGCWICANALILPGVEIGQKCVVAAGAVVTQSHTENQILIAGLPAKKIRHYE